MKAISDKLKQRGNQFNLVLNDNELNLFHSSSWLFSEILKRIDDVGFLALIKHENEWDEMEKRIKTPHYHIVMTLAYNRVSSLGNILRLFVDKFHCNENQISIEKCTDVCASVRYLIHLDNIDKESYLPFDIVSNNDALVGEYLSRIREINDIKEVIEIAHRFSFNTEQIMLHIGHSNWKKWRVEFTDLKRDSRY